MLLSAVVVAATVAIGPEVRSWSMTRPPAFSTAPSGALALTRDARGLVIAWSAGPSPSHIFVARLDDTLRAIDGTLRDIPPVSDPNFDASYPQLAVVDGNVQLLWRERQHTTAPAANTVLLSHVGDLPFWSTACADGTRLGIGAGTDGNTMVGGDPVLYTIGPSGKVSLAGIASGVLDDVAFAGSHVAYVTHSVTIPDPPPPCRCWPLMICVCPPVVKPHFDIQVISDGVTRGSLRFDNAKSGPSMSIATDGMSDLVSWATAYGDVVAIRVLPNGDGESMSNPLMLGTWSDGSSPDWVPSIASDGERWVVVWQTRRPGTIAHDIAGAVISRDGAIEPLTISCGNEDCQHPIVVATAPGLFVLGYEIDFGFDQRLLAGRYLDFNPHHQRPGGK